MTGASRRRRLGTLGIKVNRIENMLKGKRMYKGKVIYEMGYYLLLGIDE